VFRFNGPTAKPGAKNPFLITATDTRDKSIAVGLITGNATGSQDLVPRGHNNRRYEPAAPGVFFGIVYAYAIGSLLIAIIWFVLDLRPTRR
jgi:hypothetical protein